MKKILSIIFASFALVSCVDTIILPDDKTVEEDFWKTKSDVQSMINGAYTAMASEAVQQRLIIWSCRSDELNVNTSLSNSTLNQFDSNNLQTDNTYNNWASLYSVINTCNLIISKSASVMDIDPNYLEGDHNNTVAQMTALRSLCYFYLLRAFRDVPYNTIPYKNSSEELNLPQTPAGIVLDSIIVDLENVKDNALSSENVTDDTQKYGCFTRNSIYALLADCYLWRASVLHQMSDYKRCVELCNMVRDARNSSNSGHHGPASDLLDDDGFNLNSCANYYNLFASSGNNSESLLELQYTDNVALCNAYYKSSSSSNSQPWFYTNSVYGAITKDASTTVSSSVFNQKHTGDLITDIRGFESMYSFNAGSDDGIKIRKYIATKAKGTTEADEPESRGYSNFNSNWIVYRATDVMLMKAEAMIQIAKLLADNVQDNVSQFATAKTLADSLTIADNLYDTGKEIGENLVTGMRQVQIVNTRAQTDATSLYDSTAYKFNVQKAETAAYAKAVASFMSSAEKTIDNLELEVMNERARELCFEGKRWYDMLRFNYRRMTGVDYYTLLVNIGSPAKNDADFLSFMARKYTTRNGNALVANLITEPYLYMPVYKSEIEVNDMLKQNPAYKDRETAEKN